MFKILKGLINGLFFSLMLYFCALFGVIYLTGPAIPLMFFNKKVYRAYFDFALQLWVMLPGALMELFFGTKIVIQGDKISPEESALIIMNHRCRLDWMFYWMVLLRNGKLDQEKIILRDDLKLIPGPGWAMQNGMFLFLRRRWEHDKKYLNSVFDYFLEIKYPLQLLIFPEGTNYCRDGKAKSDSFAQKNNLPHYQYVLHPRVRGFNFIVQKLRNSSLKSVHDVTIGYKNGFCYGELDLFRGKFPGEIHVYITRYDIDSLPQDSDSLDNWCIQRFAEKEERLEKFYKDGAFMEHNSISTSDTIETEIAAKRKMQLALLFWCTFLAIVFYLIYYYWFFRWFGVLVSLFHLVVQVVFGGTDLLQLKLLEREKTLNTAGKKS